jgi:hypothetical protein
MKKIFLLLIVANFSFAQNCKFKVDKIDDFTKERIIETKRNDISRGCEIWFESKAKEEFIGFYYQLFPFFSVDDTSKIILLDNNGVSNEIKITKYMVCSSFYNSSLKTNIHFLAFSIKLDNSIKDFFKNNSILKMRLTTKQGDFDFDIKDKNFKKVRESLICMENANN